MNIFRTAASSIKNMMANKLRAWLSSLGIIIGVFSVVVLLAVGEWAQSKIVSQIESLGTNLLTISPGSRNSGNVRSIGWSNRNIFLMEHVSLIKSLSGVAEVAPIIQWSKQVIYKTSNTNSSIYWVTPAYETVRNITVEQWSFITGKDYLARNKVAVLWSTVVENVFGNEDPIGKTIRIENTLFTVVWVIKSKGTSGMSNQDNVIYIPLSTAQITISWSPYLSSIYISVASADIMTETQNTIQEALLKSLGKTTDTQNFTIQNQADMLDSMSSITETLKAFLAGIAAISLIVWGIGVMNILLVTVSERTKEIGIRKAIGAKSWDIIEQFLVESVILTVAWGIIGIMLSYGIVTLINKLFSSSISAVITNFHLILALSFSIGIWLFFGIFPAYKAAKMRPIDALRSE